MNVCISTNSDGIIIGYATVGTIEGGEMITVNEVPEDLCHGYYKLINGEIVLDEELRDQIANAQQDNIAP